MSVSDSLQVGGGTAWSIDELRRGLTVKRLGGNFHYFAELDSTNTYARQLAENGAGEGEIVIAEAQTQGRGRLGRRWQSPPFANLYFSVILRPELPPAQAPQITLTAAVALAETVAWFIAQPAVIKWPNDILVHGKKLAGILTEASCDAERVHYVIVGIGVNLNYRVAAMPEEIRAQATSIAELTGKSLHRESFLRRLIQGLDRCYGELEEIGFAQLAPRWEAHFGLRGKRVRVELLDQIIVGRAMGIDKDGALLVEEEHGAIKRVIAGDVIPLES
ncbi:MAG: Biotin--[acetyl-CoA-carboxylase] ligase [Deltaproteobacteria bacterium]|nr:Biotin--[acetyl-CoA-carboxylase] ligase [Deltaproteobacteria bacterium]